MVKKDKKIYTNCCNEIVSKIGKNSVESAFRKCKEENNIDMENSKLFLKDIYPIKNVTVIIDGQAGSSGKGKLCGYLAKKDNFKMATNNWASNSGHTFVTNDNEKIIVSHIPMGMINSSCKLVINAGAIITPEILIEEIRKFSEIIKDRKIYINPRAMIILEKHREQEKQNINSGSTFKGGGAALSEKIMRMPEIKLAKDYLYLLPKDIQEKIVLEDTALIINDFEDNILVEGAQGADLDINYGLDYPNVTSRQCSAAQLIADAGISPFKVKDIIMIIRPYPIRISNKTIIGKEIYSGEYSGSKEISWDEIANRCGFDGKLEEYTTVTKKVRRVFEMNFERLKYNVMINRPTQIMLNFAQYIDYKAYRCTSYDSLPIKVKEFINKIEYLTNVPVTLIGTGEREQDIIDLRK